jgi:hypothetical protein
MSLLHRDTTDSVARRLVAAGAQRELADAIVDALTGCGLAPRDVAEWLFHPELGYPIRRPFDSNGAVALIEAGEAERVLTAAREFAAASPDERLIARLFWADINGVRRLTGGDPHRTVVVAGIAATMLKRLRRPERVCNVGQTVLPGHGERRIVDRLAADEADAVAAEIADGRIDLRALDRNGELLFMSW